MNLQAGPVRWAATTPTVHKRNFFEGCMTSGASSTATDDAVQANIVAAELDGASSIRGA